MTTVPKKEIKGTSRTSRLPSVSLVGINIVTIAVNHHPTRYTRLENAVIASLTVGAFRPDDHSRPSIRHDPRHQSLKESQPQDLTGSLIHLTPIMG
jgi:hypothetical protein